MTESKPLLEAIVRMY